jgi:hypothetical protein
MNVKEGTRRLALLVGVIGLTAGGVASYATLSDAIEARSRYKVYERLACSDAVVQERKYLLSLHLSPDAVPDSINFAAIDLSSLGATTASTVTAYPHNAPPGLTFVPASGASPAALNQSDSNSAGGTGQRQAPAGAVPTSLASTLPPLPPGAVINFNVYAPYGGVVAPLVPQSVASAANKEGIKSVVWKKNLEVQSIEKEDGDVVISSQSPSLWTYLLVLIFPVVGFVIPWGAVRAIAWVGFGFVEKSE